jgi:hypothetical protein
MITKPRDPLEDKFRCIEIYSNVIQGLESKRGGTHSSRVGE